MSGRVRLVSENEACYALGQLRYNFSRNKDGISIYRHVEEPEVLAIMDFSKGPIPYQFLLASLGRQGINEDALAVYLSD